jgi:hypothetical protein
LVIQVDSFISQDKALAMQRKLIIATGRPVSIVSEAGLFKVQMQGFSEHNEAELFTIRLIEKGFPNAFIIKGQNHKLP